MPDIGPLLSGLAIALLLLVLLWFTVGTQRNVRRGNRVLIWLQEGLPVLGSRATLRWLGSSVVGVGISEANAPFREAEVMVVLEPRDLGAIWALARQRGRRDFVLIRANLVRAPRFAADLVNPAGWTPPGASQPDETLEPVSPDDAATTSYRFEDDGRAPRDDLRRAWDGLATASGDVWRIAVRQTIPHLEIHVVPPDISASGSARLFTVIRQLAETITH
jgi:hypothetical protein